ncbi:sugar ABC transporter substrate-binding protein [Microlunatus elymi]|uniref:Sugar ABC transporter substrate-binding protein n=1 Tax=Microlunatus elymi TaxID=2596828 RepID=A0A516Q425_9ACTN|nr:sugar ABC transporter substrate-binding protein [Microlunatus elymi]QDP98180.1 sugar ABC transporter substrate-binding protein [Microlunatus elymi]
MSLTRRSLLALAGVGALGGVVSGCSGALPKIDTTGAGFGQGGTGQVEIWCRGATQAGIQAFADAFNQRQQRISVRITPVPDGQFVTKLATAIRSGEVPDMVDFDDINSLLFSSRGAFADITDPVSRIPNRSALSPGHLRLATIDKRIYGLPLLADNSVLFCNTELFERAGVDLDQATKSLDGLLDAARKISRLGDNIYGWTYAGNSSGILGFTVQPHIWAAQTDLIAGPVGNQRANLVGNDAVTETLKFMRSLWQEKLVPPGSYADSGTQWGADFRAGTIGMFPGNFQSVVNGASKSFLDKLEVRLLPGPDGGGAFFDGGDNLCMLNGAPNPSAAWEFASFCVAPEQQEQLPKSGFVPIRSDAITADFRRSFPLAVLTATHLDAGYAPKTLAYNVIYNQADGPWLAMFRRAVFSGQVEAAMQAAESGYNRLLKQAQA